ncbi:MAG: DUF3426 domain-containing protein [Alphaproteobacteria bacterium]
MLIICPKCFAKYEVDTRSLRKTRQVFECTKCHHRFEERVDYDEKSADTPALTPAQSEGITPVSEPMTPDINTDETLKDWAATPADFRAQSSTVLPEEFTPVSDTESSNGRKALFLFLALMIVVGLIGFCVWANKESLLTKAPALDKAWRILTDKPLVINDVSAVPTSLGVAPQPIETPRDTNYMPMHPAAEGQSGAPAADGLAGTPSAHGQIPPIKDVHPIAPNPLKTVVNVAAEAQDDTPVFPVTQTQPVGQVLKSDSILPVETGQALPVTSAEEAHVVPDKPVQTPTAKITAPAVQVPTRSLTEGQDDIEDVTVEEIDLSDMPAPLVGTVPVSAGERAAAAVVQNVSFRYDSDDVNAPRIFIQGIVKNTTNDSQPMPALAAQLFDKNGVLLGVKDLPHGDLVLNPQAGEFFFFEVNDLPNGLIDTVRVAVKGQ